MAMSAAPSAAVIFADRMLWESYDEGPSGRQMPTFLTTCPSILRYAIPILGLLVGCVPAPSAAVPRTQTSWAGVDAAVVDEMTRTSTPGIAIALISGDSVVYARGFGMTAETGGVAVTPSTVFRIASVTKMFTAATLVELAAAGRLDLDAPIGRLLPELPDSLRGITAHQLLSHTGGLVFAPLSGAGRDPVTALALVMKSVPARVAFTPPGQVFSYANVGYQLAGRLIEIASGHPYAEQVQSALLAPLGMTSTTFDSVTASRLGLALGFIDPLVRAPPGASSPASWPFAGLYSNVLDLSRFAITFVNGGKQAISPQTIARISRPVAPFNSGEGDYGYGVRVYRHRGVDVVEHGGVGFGYRSLLYMVPSRRVAIVVLANRAGRRPYAIADAALDALLAGAVEPPPPMSGEVPIDSTEMRRYVGRYASGTVVDVTIDRGELLLRQGDISAPIRKLADGRLVIHDDAGSNWIAFVREPDGSIRYAHFNMRAYRRVE
jgi:D-alanyl-D-alanine carboxypeptidase